MVRKQAKKRVKHSKSVDTSLSQTDLIAGIIPKKTFFNIILVVASLGFCFLAIDVAVRFMMPQNSDIVEYDDNVLHQYVPNKARLHIKDHADGGEHIWININEHGMRGESFELEKTKKRVLVYGDSFIASVYSPLEKTFPAQLENYLQLGGHDVEVLNAGVEAYGPDQISVRMEEELELFNPDLVIVSLYVGNDFGDLTTGQIYGLNGNELVKNNYAVPFGFKFRKKISHWFPSTIIYFKGLRGIKSSLSGAVASDEVGDNLAPLIARHESNCKRSQEKKDFRYVTSMFSDEPDVDIAINPDTECSQYKINLMDRVLKQMRRHAAAHDTKIVAMIIPMREDIEDSRFKDWVDTEEHPSYSRSRQTDIVSTLTEANKISALNLYQPFRENGADGSFYWSIDLHWNDNAQAFAAELMTQKLIEEKLI